MANLWYDKAKQEMMDGTLNLSSSTLKVMLVSPSYVPNNDDEVVDSGAANSPLSTEINGTGYVKGWGQSGRHTLASKTFPIDKPNNRSVIDAADSTWTAITASTIGGAIIIKEGGSNDTTSRLIWFIDVIPDFITNGGAFTLQWNTDGIFQLT